MLSSRLLAAAVSMYFSSNLQVTAVSPASTRETPRSSRTGSSSTALVHGAIDTTLPLCRVVIKLSCRRLCSSRRIELVDSDLPVQVAVELQRNLALDLVRVVDVAQIQVLAHQVEQLDDRHLLLQRQIEHLVAIGKLVRPERRGSHGLCRRCRPGGRHRGRPGRRGLSRLRGRGLGSRNTIFALGGPCRSGRLIGLGRRRRLGRLRTRRPRGGFAVLRGGGCR